MKTFDTRTRKLSELLGQFQSIQQELSDALGAAQLLLLQVGDYLDRLHHSTDHPLVQAGAAFSRQLAAEIASEEVG
jgi:hypothetical protein